MKRTSHTPEISSEEETLREERESESTVKLGMRGRRTSQTMKRTVPRMMKTAIRAAKKRRKKVARGGGYGGGAW